MWWGFAGCNGNSPSVLVNKLSMLIYVFVLMVVDDGVGVGPIGRGMETTAEVMEGIRFHPAIDGDKRRGSHWQRRRQVAAGVGMIGVGVGSVH